MTHHPAVYFRGASDLRKDFSRDVKVPKKQTAVGFQSRVPIGQAEDGRPAGEPAELRVPLHGVDVEQHGAAGVGHVRAVDPTVAAPRQALREVQTKTRQVKKKPQLLAPVNARQPARWRSHPDDPRVHRAKHGLLLLHRHGHVGHVVQQPAELDGAEVGADGKARLWLQTRKRRGHGNTEGTTALARLGAERFARALCRICRKVCR